MTYELRRSLQRELYNLRLMDQNGEIAVCEDGAPQMGYEWYMAHYLPFGDLLTDLEREGIKVSDRQRRGNVEEEGEKDERIMG